MLKYHKETQNPLTIPKQAEMEFINLLLRNKHSQTISTKNNFHTTLISSYTRLFLLLEKYPMQINGKGQIYLYLYISISPLHLSLDKLWAAFLAKLFTFWMMMATMELLHKEGRRERTGQEFREGTFSGLSVFALACFPSFWQCYHHINEFVCNKRIFPTLVSI